MASFFPSLKQNFIAYRSSKVSSCPDYIFEIHQLWQSGFSRVYSNCCCSCWFEAEIIKIGQSSHKMYSNNIVNFQESMTILNAHTKKVWKLIVCTLCVCVCVCVYIYIYIYASKVHGLMIKQKHLYHDCLFLNIISYIVNSLNSNGEYQLYRLNIIQ